jgi:serine protease Do
VASVETGSPAARTGIEAGDIVTALEGLLLATDGTMADYCDILRSHTRTDPLKVEVVRYATSEVYEGVLNETPLELSFSFAQELGGDVTDAGPSTYSEYASVTDDSGTIQVSLPVEWTDVRGLPWDYQGSTVGVSIAGSTDLDAWYSGWDTPGVFFSASSSLVGTVDIPTLLQTESFEGDCTLDGRYDYSDPLYTGQYDLYSDCGGIGTTFIVLAAQPEDGSSIILVEIAAVSEADLEAIDQILNTFVIVGTL